MQRKVCLYKYQHFMSPRGWLHSTVCCPSLLTGLFLTSKIVLSSPLPRVYEETGGGKVVPVTPASIPGSDAQGTSVLLPIGGSDFSGEELARVSKETGKKLESEVLAPMERWLNAFALVQNRMRKLEALRLEVDSRRRTVANLGKKVDQQRAQLPQTRARGEYDMENTIKVLQHKEAKLSACRQSYKEHEALVYHQLTNLIRDTVWLKSYLSAVMRLETEAFQVGNAALGHMKALSALPAPMQDANDGQMSNSAGELDYEASEMSDTPDVIPAARSNGAPMPHHARMASKGGVGPGAHSVTATATTKDSLYELDDLPSLPGARERGAQYAGDSYTRQPMSAW